MTPERHAARAEFERLTHRGPGRPFACGVKVSEPQRLPGGPGGATPLGCSFCGCVLSDMCGPGGPGLVCQLCATAIRDPGHPLGMLLRDAWADALRELYRG